MQVRVLSGYSSGDDVALATSLRGTYADRDAVTAMFKELCDRVQGGAFRNLVLNGSQLEYVSSATLGKLMTLSRLLTQAKGRLKLCCLEPQFHDILRTTRLNEVFELFETEEAALASFKEKQAAVAADNEKNNRGGGGRPTIGPGLIR
jgi:anti-sigma B factor antagonist